MRDIARSTTKHSNSDGPHGAEHRLSRYASGALRLLLAIAMLCASVAPVAAETQRTIYRCIGINRAISYQDVPCDPHQRTSATRRYTVETVEPTSDAQRRSRKETSHRERGAQRVTSIVVSKRQTPKPPSRCEAAKAKRESGLARLGFKRDFDLMSALDRTVWDACKGL
jgi:hypothetical protein